MSETVDSTPQTDIELVIDPETANRNRPNSMLFGDREPPSQSQPQESQTDLLAAVSNNGDGLKNLMTQGEQVVHPSLQRIASPDLLIQHVKSNFGKVLSPVLEKIIYRQGWMNLDVGELYTQLAINYQVCFSTAVTDLGPDHLRQAILEVLTSILEYSHREQTTHVVLALAKNSSLAMLFYSMFDPSYLKQSVEDVIEKERRAALQRQMQHQQQLSMAQQQLQQQNSPTKESPIKRSPTSPLPPLPRSKASGSSTPVSSPTQATQIPIPRSAAAAATGVPPPPSFSPYPSQSAVAARREEQQAPESEEVLSPSDASQRLFPNGKPHQDPNQPAIPAPRTTTALSNATITNVKSPSAQHPSSNMGSRGNSNDAAPVSPLVAAFGAKKEPATPKKSEDNVVNQLKNAIEQRDQRSKESSPTSSHGRSGSNLLKAMATPTKSNNSNSQSLSWAEDDMEDPHPTPEHKNAKARAELETFLHKHELDSLQKTLVSFSLPQLRSMPLSEFEARLKRQICSSSMRKKLLDALHPDGQLPKEQPQAAPEATGNRPSRAPPKASSRQQQSPRQADPDAYYYSEDNEEDTQARSVPAPRSRQSGGGIPAPRSGGRAMEKADNSIDFVLFPSDGAGRNVGEKALITAIEQQCGVRSARVCHILFQAGRKGESATVKVRMNIGTHTSESASRILDSKTIKVAQCEFRRTPFPPQRAQTKEEQPPRESKRRRARHASTDDDEPPTRGNTSFGSKPSSSGGKTPVLNASRPERCKFFGTEKGCRRGADCMFVHEE